MGRLILHNLKHFFITFSILFALLIGFGLYIGADAHFNQNPLAYKLDKEGPHIFYQDKQLSVQTLQGNKETGYSVAKVLQSGSEPFDVKTHFALEDLDFEIRVDPKIQTPPVSYQDEAPIIAISDIESGFKTFRDFLLANQVINEQLQWVFGTGHLVLVGDFVDRGDSVTQVLWFIYKLEQEAKSAGGQVHFIIGNHEIKNMQGNFDSASEKYFYIASILEKSQQQLYDNDSFIGRWMASKNSAEVINGVLFTHGGIHPQLAEMDLTLEQLNQAVRKQYRNPYFTRKDKLETDFIVSSSTGPSWYRGYFKDDLSQSEVESGLNKFGARAVVVGHTLHSKVKKLYQGRVFAIDVKHPKDYVSSFPTRRSEGLLIDGEHFYRLLDDGEKLLW